MPNRFFIESVAPAQWCVFILGMETSRLLPSTVCGKSERRREISGGGGQIERTPAMAGARRNRHRCAQFPERFEAWQYQHGMRVDGAFGLELHQVGFQYHTAAAHVEFMLGQHAAH